MEVLRLFGSPCKTTGCSNKGGQPDSHRVCAMKLGSVNFVGQSIKLCSGYRFTYCIYTHIIIYIILQICMYIYIVKYLNKLINTIYTLLHTQLYETMYTTIITWHFEFLFTSNLGIRNQPRTGQKRTTANPTQQNLANNSSLDFAPIPNLAVGRKNCRMLAAACNARKKQIVILILTNGLNHHQHTQPEVLKMHLSVLLQIGKNCQPAWCEDAEPLVSTTWI